jgi:hypothetical protein
VRSACCSAWPCSSSRCSASRWSPGSCGSAGSARGSPRTSASEDGLGAELESLPRRPSGRIDRGAADEHFAKVREETEADPDRWQAWYRLSLAYDAAGDRSRARAAARHAIELHRRTTL